MPCQEAMMAFRILKILKNWLVVKIGDRWCAISESWYGRDFYLSSNVSNTKNLIIHFDIGMFFHDTSRFPNMLADSNSTNMTDSKVSRRLFCPRDPPRILSAHLLDQAITKKWGNWKRGRKRRPFFEKRAWELERNESIQCYYNTMLAAFTGLLGACTVGLIIILTLTIFGGRWSMLEVDDCGWTLRKQKTPMTPEKSDWQVQQELEEKDCLGLFIFMWVVLSLFRFFLGGWSGIRIWS